MSQEEIKETIEELITEQNNSILDEVFAIEDNQKTPLPEILQDKINNFYILYNKNRDVLTEIYDADLHFSTYEMTLSADNLTTDTVLKKEYFKTDFSTAYALAVNDYLELNPNQEVENFSFFCKLKTSHGFFDITGQIVNYLTIIDIDELK